MTIFKNVFLNSMTMLWRIIFAECIFKQYDNAMENNIYRMRFQDLLIDQRTMPRCLTGDRRGHDRIVDGFTTTYTIRDYHH